MTDQLLPQPPPDAPAPPPSEAALLSRRKMGWMIGLGIGSVFLLAILFSQPVVIRGHYNKDHVQAVKNLHQVGNGLLEFEAEYGKFPDETTAVRIKRETGTKLTLSDHSSNDIFVQLIAAGMAEERNFGTSLKFYTPPDGVCDTDAKALAHGETAFAYISGLSFEGKPYHPIVFGPVIPGTTRLDPKPFDGKAVVLKLDGSVTSIRISPSGEIILYGQNMNMLDPNNPIWGGKPFTVKWPK